jgi:hypothetical protein
MKVISLMTEIAERTLDASRRRSTGNASNAGGLANRGIQGKEKRNRELLGLVDMVVHA